MIKDFISLAALTSITIMLVIHILFMRSCSQEANNVLSWNKALNDNEILRAIITRLYWQRHELNYSKLVIIVICFFMFLGQVLK